jgi:hypothetical protein
MFGFQTGVFGNTSQHLRADLIALMKSEYNIGVARSRENLVRTGFSFDYPPEAVKRREHTLSFS